MCPIYQWSDITSVLWLIYQFTFFYPSQDKWMLPLVLMLPFLFFLFFSFTSSFFLLLFANDHCLCFFMQRSPSKAFVVHGVICLLKDLCWLIGRWLAKIIRVHFSHFLLLLIGCCLATFWLSYSFYFLCQRKPL